jgi:hypothetical protein
MVADKKTKTFLTLFQSALITNLEHGKLNGHGLSDVSKSNYKKQIKLLATNDLEYLKSFISKAKSSEVENNFEKEVLQFICEKFHYNKNHKNKEKAFKLVIHCIYLTIINNNLTGVNIFNVLYIQMLLELIKDPSYEEQIFDIVNHVLDLCKIQPFDEQYKEFYDFKQSLILRHGYTTDCKHFQDVSITGQSYFLGNYKAHEFTKFLNKYYKGLSKFVVEL